MSFIYKITNNINNKIYIGYTSQTLAIRWSQHKYDALHPKQNKKSLLHQAMIKYGFENFSIETIYNFNEHEEDWRKLEQKYIKELNSKVPNGYNILDGGEMPPIHYGDDNNKTKLSDEKLQLLLNDLKNVSLSYCFLSEKYGLSVSQIQRINQGKARFQKDIDYPIRKYNQNEIYVLEIMEILSTDTTLSNKKIAQKFPNYFRANEIASINNGKKYAYLWEGDFPIRKVLVPDNYEEKQDLAKRTLDYIYNNSATQELNSNQLSKIMGISRGTIMKILNGVYPYVLKEVDYPIKL